MRWYLLINSYCRGKKGLVGIVFVGDWKATEVRPGGCGRASSRNLQTMSESSSLSPHLGMGAVLASRLSWQWTEMYDWRDTELNNVGGLGIRHSALLNYSNTFLLRTGRNSNPNIFTLVPPLISISCHMLSRFWQNFGLLSLINGVKLVLLNSFCPKHLLRHRCLPLVSILLSKWWPLALLGS